MQARQLAVIVLAAGKGTRMKSDRAKVLHDLQSKPMLAYVLDALTPLAPEKVIVVVGHQAEEVKKAFSDRALDFVIQEPQLGTGHAVQVTESALQDFEGTVLITCGDMPLVQVETLQALVDAHQKSGAACTLLSLKTGEKRDFGRVIRDVRGQVLRIVEARDATDEEKTVDEYNSGVYCFEKGLLFKVLADLDSDNAQQEFYLTDTIRLLNQDGHSVNAVPTSNESEIIGINSLEDLKRAEMMLS